MRAEIVVMVIAATAVGSASAAQRTFVRSDGVDANLCSILAPCRSFGTAITHTDPDGEIVVLDSAGYGIVTVNKGVTITAPPASTPASRCRTGATASTWRRPARRSCCAASRLTARSAT